MVKDTLEFLAIDPAYLPTDIAVNAFSLLEKYFENIRSEDLEEKRLDSIIDMCLYTAYSFKEKAIEYGYMLETKKDEDKI